MERLVAEAGFDEASARDAVTLWGSTERRKTKASRRSRRRKREKFYARRRDALREKEFGDGAASATVVTLIE
ncbi:MAG: hypothetical protein WA484_10305 [Solirubrobacteraceae bacterium]